MGLTAENLAEQYGISREGRMHFALRSHGNAGSGDQGGRFRDEISPVPILNVKGTSRKYLIRDEHPQAECT